MSTHIYIYMHHLYAQLATFAHICPHMPNNGPCMIYAHIGHTYHAHDLYSSMPSNLRSAKFTMLPHMCHEWSWFLDTSRLCLTSTLTDFSSTSCQVSQIAILPGVSCTTGLSMHPIGQLWFYPPPLTCTMKRNMIIWTGQAVCIPCDQ